MAFFELRKEKAAVDPLNGSAGTACTAMDADYSGHWIRSHLRCISLSGMPCIQTGFSPFSIRR
jgi:hypothetical protein